MRNKDTDRASDGRKDDHKNTKRYTTRPTKDRQTNEN